MTQSKSLVSSITAACAILWLATSILAVDTLPEITVKDEPGRIVVFVDTQAVATYVYADDKIPRPYFSHVCEPGGIQLTRNFPPIEGQDATDHGAMHPGIWMAFGDLNGTDIWRNKGRVVHEQFLKPPAGGCGKATFTVHNRYETVDGELLCREECRQTFIARPNGCFLLWDSTFSADRKFYFGDQEEMGVGLRMATPIAVKSGKGGRILDSEGRKNEKSIWGKTAKWCDYSGPIDGKFAGIAIMPHPDNFRPCWWHTRDYGFVAANPFGRAAFHAGPGSKVMVEPNAPLCLRFGILIHANSHEADLDLSAAYQHYLSLSQ
jgi:hypothetical protein